MPHKIATARKENPHKWGSLPWASEEMKTTRQALDVAIDTIAGRIAAEEARPIRDQNYAMLIELKIMEFELSNLSKAVDDVWKKPEDRAMDIIMTSFDLRMKMTREEITKSFFK